MNQTVDSRKYYPTALVLYITYFVLGIAASIMGQYKQDFAAMWDAAVLTDGSYDVSGVVAVIAAIGLGWLIAFPVAGPCPTGWAAASPPWSATPYTPCFCWR